MAKTLSHPGRASSFRQEAALEVDSSLRWTPAYAGTLEQVTEDSVLAGTTRFVVREPWVFAATPNGRLTWSRRANSTATCHDMQAPSWVSRRPACADLAGCWTPLRSALSMTLWAPAPLDNGTATVGGRRGRFADGRLLGKQGAAGLSSG